MKFLVTIGISSPPDYPLEAEKMQAEIQAATEKEACDRVLVQMMRIYPESIIALTADEIKETE